MIEMPVRLPATTVSKIASLPNSTNAALMSEFYQYMKDNGASESHTNNSLNFYDVKTKEQIIAFLDKKIKSVEEDLHKKWITTWNDYLNDIKYFF